MVGDQAELYHGLEAEHVAEQRLVASVQQAGRQGFRRPGNAVAARTEGIMVVGYIYILEEKKLRSQKICQV